MPDFVVLRDARGTYPAPTFAPSMRDFGAAPNAFNVPEPTIAVESLDDSARADLLRDPAVVGHAPLIPTRLIQPLAADGDPPAGSAWGVAAVGADKSSYTGAGTVVAVLDTGIDGSHPAFTGVDLRQQDFTGTGKGDHVGHGTHCAGTIFGRDVDGERIGIARGVPRALIGKVLDDKGAGTSDSIFKGIEWAVDAGAQVISMSLGFDFPGMVLERSKAGWPIDLATSAALEAYRANLRLFDSLMDMVQSKAFFSGGAVLVAAAGNESKREVNPNYEIGVSLPAAAQGVISVGALGQTPAGLQVGPFSNTLPVVAAPGVDIKSAKVGGGTVGMTGTSMAAPHVAGVAALWWEAVQKQGLPANAQTVAAKMLAMARVDGFAPDVDVADRGNGLISAPA